MGSPSGMGKFFFFLIAPRKWATLGQWSRPLCFADAWLLILDRSSVSNPHPGGPYRGGLWATRLRSSQLHRTPQGHRCFRVNRYTGPSPWRPDSRGKVRAVLLRFSCPRPSPAARQRFRLAVQIPPPMANRRPRRCRRAWLLSSGRNLTKPGFSSVLRVIFAKELAPDFLRFVSAEESRYGKLDFCSRIVRSVYLDDAPELPCSLHDMHESDFVRGPIRDSTLMSVA